MVELADTPDLGSSVYPQNLIGLSGYGGIGRRVRFRFLCHMACGFKSHWPHKIRLFVKWIILQGALFFVPFWKLINTMEIEILDLTAILTAVYIFYGFSENEKRGIIGMLRMDSGQTL